MSSEFACRRIEEKVETVCGRAVVGGDQTDEVVHPARSIFELEILVGERPSSLGPSDQINLVGVSAGQHHGDESSKSLGRLSHVSGEGDEAAVWHPVEIEGVGAVSASGQLLRHH